MRVTRVCWTLISALHSECAAEATNSVGKYVAALGRHIDPPTDRPTEDQFIDIMAARITPLKWDSNLDSSSQRTCIEGQKFKQENETRTLELTQHTIATPVTVYGSE